MDRAFQSIRSFWSQQKDAPLASTLPERTVPTSLPIQAYNAEVDVQPIRTVPVQAYNAATELQPAAPITPSPTKSVITSAADAEIGTPLSEVISSSSTSSSLGAAAAVTARPMSSGIVFLADAEAGASLDQIMPVWK